MKIGKIIKRLIFENPDQENKIVINNYNVSTEDQLQKMLAKLRKNEK